jgi:diguanylate cyclase (GGDEF)-like protein
MGRNGAGHSDDAPDRVSRSDGERQDEKDQTLSEKDQTLSEKDQTLSDRDQQASDDDQDAADAERQHGGGWAGYAESSAIRAGTTRDRLDVGRDRGGTSDERDRAARERDMSAERRDRDADAADVRALEIDGADGLPGARAMRLRDLRARAEEGRLRARRDRERAAHDRQRAAHDRQQAAHDREHARRELQAAGTDELTGARRRGVGLAELQREIDRAKRTGHGLVAAYVDVDGLKTVNDTDGHGAGDEVLRAVVKALRTHMRAYDLLVRLGGDEFLCVLPDIGVDEARRRFGALSSDLSDGPTERSVSVGFAVLRDGDFPHELVERADRDLLAARSV